MEKINKILLTTSNLETEEIAKMATSLEEIGCDVVISEFANNDCELDEVDDGKVLEEIDGCEVVFVLVGPNGEESECLEDQIEKAADHDKKIVGIFMGGTIGNVPSGLEVYGDGLITNDLTKIIKVLEGIVIPWENPEGANRTQQNNMDKGEC